MGVEMRIARTFALRYALRDSEEDIFKRCWELRKRADPYPGKGPIGDHYTDEQTQAEVILGFERLADAVLGRGYVTALGHRYVERRATPGQKYVVFSDHHWAFAGHRQNFFADSGNRTLYREVLQQYLDAGYFLIENGDVEELIIFEPTLAEIEQRLDMTWAQLDARRHTVRLDQLRRIVDDPNNQSLYEMIARFHSAGRYLKVAGNHDYDLQKDDFLAVLRTRLSNIAPPADYVFLETPTEVVTPSGRVTLRHVDFVIAHGHQFDRSTNPAFAPRIGELISETVGWPYQGADRVWRWNDDVRPWALGLDGYWNNLVTDDYNDHFTLNVHGRDLWEGIFKHQIAWEYFEHTDPLQAILHEVATGDEWFKFRHLDEVFIRNQLMARFTDANRPKLVLGHSHEPRFRPAAPLFKNPTHRDPFPYYFNSGAAGRYENLLWGLEIDNGTPRIVSWSRQEPRAGAPMRRLWSYVDHQALGASLQASIQPVPLGS